MSEHLAWSSVLIIPAGLYIAMAGYLFLFQNSLLYHPPRGLWTTPGAWGLLFEPVTLTSQGFKLRGWWIPGSPQQPVVLFFHGNASSIADLQPHTTLFHHLGLGVLLFDYRGYGESEGKPTEAGTYADAQVAWDHLTAERKIPSERLIYYGHSLGGGIATWLAQRHPPRALILESTFTSIPDVAAGIYPFLPIRWLARIEYNTFQRIQTIQAPVLIIHSPEDEVIPFLHGHKLFAAAREPKKFLKSLGRHNEGFTSAGKWAETQLKAFLFP